jgi:hypothetical protein
MSEGPLTFPVSVGLLDGKHTTAMPGQCLFIFLWFVSRVTQDYPSVNGRFAGVVLGGKPIELLNVASELGMEYWTVRRYAGMLVTAGYLERRKTSSGSCSTVL